MEETAESHCDNILDIKKEILGLRNEFNRFVEQSGRQQIGLLLTQMEQRYFREMMDYIMEDTNQRLASGMNPECKMREECTSVFLNLLTDVSRLLGSNRVDESTLQEFRERFDRLKEGANTGNCDMCIAEASGIFEREMKLIRSLKGFESTDDTGDSIVDFPEEEAVRQICEPLANKQRVCILKALATETKTFSQLSGLTKLRGGNLRFHLQKLLDTGMILQHEGRGDYMITSKGYMALKNLSGIYSRLKNAT
jgi:DNA-binding transcriptional ArsR family regulator